jgi:hypothetical protein
MNLEHALYSLLYRRRAREALASSDAERLGISSKELGLLATVDREQLERAARLATEGILSRAYWSDGTLLEAYPRTIEAWRRANPRRTLEDLAADFAESPHFEGYRAIPAASNGTSLEEAFFRFCEEEGIADRATRKAECARAVIRSLVTTPAPSFRLPDFVLPAPKCHFAIVEEDDGTTLFAAIEHRLITGRITPFLAGLLASREPPSVVAIQFDVSAAELAASCTVLRRMGLLA